MDLKIVRALTRLMADNELVELEVESPDLKVKLSKAKQTVFAQPLPAPVAALPTAAVTPPPAAEPAAAADFAGCSEITSPIPGTFYSRPNPDAPVYTKVGDTVEAEQVLCLIEAMKVFNEIKADRSGVIKKVCVEDGQAVEYGTTLFIIG